MDERKYVITMFGPGVIVARVLGAGPGALLVKVPRDTMTDEGKAKYHSKFPFIIFKEDELEKVVDT